MSSSSDVKKWCGRLFADRHFVAVLLTLAVFSLLFFALGEKKGIPSWIQATGSVLAIIGASWIAGATRRAEEQQKRRAIFAVAESAQAYAKKLRNSIDTSRLEDGTPGFAIHDLYHRSVTDGLAQALANIPFHEVGSHEAVLALLSTQGQFARFLPQSIEAFIAGPDNHPVMKDTIHDYDDYPEPKRGEHQRDLRKKQRNTLANNVCVNLKRIDRDFETIQRAIGK